MKKALTLILLVVSIVAYSATDDIIGTWYTKTVFTSQIYILEQVNFMPDGKVTYKILLIVGEQKKLSSDEGTYKIVNGQLNITDGRGQRNYKIVTLTPEKMILFNLKNNETEIYVRQ